MARVIDLQEQTEITEDAYILTDNATTGTHKFNLKQLYDDSQSAIVSAQSAANSASSAAATAREAAASAQSMASEAESVVDGAAETLATAAERVDAAIDAVGDISELAVPEMSADVRGGAKLDADGGLALRDGALGIGSLVQESDGTVRGGIASLTAKGHAEQTSTAGKNLLPNKIIPQTLYGVTFTQSDDGTVVANGTATSLIVLKCTAATLSPGTYTLSGCPSDGDYTSYRLDLRASSDQSIVSGGVDYGDGATFTLKSGTTCFKCIRIASGYTCNNLTFHPQLELGSTATEYEPYSGGVPSPSPDWPQEIVTVTGHAITGKTGRYVDLEVRQGSTLLSTTPIPLPSRGWVGSLPDGTADVLRLDGAGKVEWELPTSEVVLDGSVSLWQFGNSSASGYVYAFYNKYDSIVARNSASAVLKDAGLCDMLPLSNSLVDTHISAETINVGSDSGHVGHIRIGLLASRLSQATSSAFAAWLAENPITVLCHLATPVTEQCGYVEMPSIAGDATVSIPELDELGVRYFVDDAVVEYGRQIYERVRSEYADRIERLEQSVAELATA